MKQNIVAIVASIALGGCATMSDCNGLQQPQYSDCVARVNAQNAAGAAIAGALVGAAVGAAATARSNTYYYAPSGRRSTTTCIGDRNFATCDTVRY